MSAAADRRAETQRASLDRWALEMESKLDAGLLSASAWNRACDAYFARLAEIEADLRRSATSG